MASFAAIAIDRLADLMVDKQIQLKQKVLEIYNQTLRLDTVRRQLFLRWLKSHSGVSKFVEEAYLKVMISQKRMNAECLNILNRWLGSLPEKKLFSEYYLILSEIHWWQSLEPQALVKFLEPQDKDHHNRHSDL